jgi:hypothetical protein
MNEYLKKSEELYSQARHFRQVAEQKEEKAHELRKKGMEIFLREKEDRLISKRETLDLLWFNSYTALRQWEKRVNPIGYLEFTGNKILRSEVLRFLDDYHSRTVERKLRGLPLNDSLS